MKWYYYIVIYGFYLFTFGPSILNSLYFLTTMHSRIKEHEWIKSSGVTLKCIIIMLIFLCVPAIAITSVFYPKGIHLYFACSALVFYQFYFSCKIKKYSFGRVLFYDVLLTFLLCWYAYFLPSLNFLPLTLKDLIIFWNFYIGLLVFGVILTRVGIKR